MGTLESERGCSVWHGLIKGHINIGSKPRRFQKQFYKEAIFFDSHVKYISYNNLPKEKNRFFLLIETVEEKTTTEIKPHFTIKELRI